MKQHKNLLTKGTLAAAVLAMVFAGTAYAADTATGTGNGVAQGTNSQATDATDTAVGKTAKATGKGSTAIGNGAAASGANSVAEGNGATASGVNSVAEGYQAKASASSALAVGNGANATAENAAAFGALSRAIGIGSVSLGASSTANSEGTVALGRSSFADGKSSIAIGDYAQVKSNGYSLTSIAIGRNAYALNGTGQQEYEFSFNKDSWIKTSSGFFSYKYDPKEGTDALDRLPGGIAIGTNAYARTGSVEIGSHTMQGMTMAGTTVDKTSANIIDMTTIGTNSYNKGMMATIVGAYSINTGDFDGSGGFNSLSYGSQNMGSVLIGSLNQNRSKGNGGYSGIANTMVGVANIAENANGALIYGAGNKITNSNSYINFSGNTGADSADDLLDKLATAVKNSDAGGAVLAIGGGNTADYAKHSMMIGVNTTLTGTQSDVSEFNMINGFDVTAKNVDHVTSIGYKNTISDSSTVQLIGDNRKLTNVKNSVILGSAESEMELTASKATILGYNANVQAEGGVALGAGSILNDSESGLDQSGYNPATKTNSTDTSYIWRPTLAAVSVGVSGTDTRRITNVAAGINDTDAVNVAQLKQVAGSAGGSANLIAGDGIKLVKGTDGSWTISTNFENSGSDEVTYKDATNTGDTTNTDSGTTPDTGKAAVIETKLTADDGNTTSLGDNNDNQLGIKGDGENIKTSVSGSDVKVALSKDLSVSSITINNGGPTINEGGIDMNNTKITNIADGDVYEGSKDAVNGGQLWSVQQGMNGRISRLDTKINRVGAGAAALANLHPLDFDPDDKWSFSTGFGNYRNANALAVGAFYRPDEKSMVNISGTFGNGENMVGLGASFKLGKESSVTKGNLQKTITNLQTLVASQDKAMKAQNEKIAKLEAIVAQLMAK